MLNVPVVLLVFNRPDTTLQVWRKLQTSRPTQLFVVADGPRPGRGEERDCSLTRAVTNNVSWDCKVNRCYSDQNMGCAQRVTSGLDWVFGLVDRAIILEDDCVPDLSFFTFAEELLERYSTDSRVMAVSGDCFQPRSADRGFSYFFSRYPHVWGWATWARAWRHHDLEMSLWPEMREHGWLHDVLQDDSACRYWTQVFDHAYRREIDTWDYAWTFTCWAQGGLTALPRVNLVHNVGFDQRATHTTVRTPGFPPPSSSIHFPLKHPPFIIRDTRADTWSEKALFSGLASPSGSAGLRVIRKLSNRLFSLIRGRRE